MRRCEPIEIYNIALGLIFLTISFWFAQSSSCFFNCKDQSEPLDNGHNGRCDLSKVVCAIFFLIASFIINLGSCFRLCDDTSNRIKFVATGNTSDLHHVRTTGKVKPESQTKTYDDKQIQFF